MVCPECGREIPEGHLYCDTCGMEVRIVPDFEPEVENSITESLSGVVEALTGRKADETDGGRERQKNLFVLSLGCVFVFALIVLAAYFSINAYLSSVEYQYKKAMEKMEEGDYVSALVYFRNAKEAGGSSEEIMSGMTACYQALGDEQSYIESLYELIYFTETSRERLEQGYSRMISYYEEKGKYEQIDTLLQDCTDSSIREKYINYMANPPEFNYVEGAYNEALPLKILSNTKGHIYYTMDGSNPDESSEEYTSPIFLETGKYEITAVFVNEYGIKSAYAKARYQIDVSAPFAPEIDLYSGDFYEPQMLHVEAEEGCQIYYTTDGSEPDGLSRMYSGFLPMPIGDSSFKFVAIDENGLSSETTTRNFHLELRTEHTPDDAQFVILSYLSEAGRIIGIDGTISSEDPRKMVYSYACCVKIADEGDFYIFSEYIENPDGRREKTGNYYAVGVYRMPLYTTHYDARTGNFALGTQMLWEGILDTLEEELIGLSEEELHRRWGEPDGVLSGFWGDIWNLGALSDRQIIVYYSAEGIVETVKVDVKQVE